MKIQHFMALVVLSLATVPGARAAVRGFKRCELSFRAFSPWPLVAAPATAQVNYAVSGSTAYVTSSPNASGAHGAITGAAGTEIELQYAGDGQFRITRARGRVEVDGTVISEILPRRL